MDCLYSRLKFLSCRYFAAFLHHFIDESATPITIIQDFEFVCTEESNCFNQCTIIFFLNDQFESSFEDFLRFFLRKNWIASIFLLFLKFKEKENFFYHLFHLRLLVKVFSLQIKKYLSQKFIQETTIVRNRILEELQKDGAKYLLFSKFLYGNLKLCFLLKYSVLQVPG